MKELLKTKKFMKNYDDLHDEDESDEEEPKNCLLYTSPSPRDLSTSRMPSSA